MHDIVPGRCPPPVENDPFRFINRILEIAAANSDFDVFEKGTNSLLRISDLALATAEGKDQDFRFFVEHLIENAFWATKHTVSDLTRDIVCRNTFITVVSWYLKEKALSFKQVRSPFAEIAGELAKCAIALVKESSRDGVMLITSLLRELAQKGIYDDPDPDEHFLFKQHLAMFPRQIEEIGSAAVLEKNSDLLYRCLEDLGFLGCSAVKKNHTPVGIACMQALVQIGREARANKVKCFWTHCALEQVDHAEQRLWWMLTWTNRLDESDRDRWLRSFENAYSRLRGFQTKIAIAFQGDKAMFDIKTGKEPFIESYSEDGYSREINYADYDETKEFILH